MQEYLTKTERIQSYIKELLADEKKHSTREITEYVDSKLKENGEFVFQINSYVNAAMSAITIPSMHASAIIYCSLPNRRYGAIRAITVTR